MYKNNLNNQLKEYEILQDILETNKIEKQFALNYLIINFITHLKRLKFSHNHFKSMQNQSKSAIN